MQQWVSPASGHRCEQDPQVWVHGAGLIGVERAVICNTPTTYIIQQLGTASKYPTVTASTLGHS